MTQPVKYPDFGVLLVDDEASFLRSFSLLLERSAGITNLECCQDSRKVMERLSYRDIRLVLLDLTMPHLSGQELLKKINVEYPEIVVIIISGLNQIDTAVACIKKGAFDYYVKTEEEDRIVQGIIRAIKLIDLLHENQDLRDRFLRDKLEHPEAFAHIITTAKSMRSIFQYIESVSGSRHPVLITGESGVGKELIASAIHRLSHVTGSLVAINVAGLDDNIFADTLFGHRKGAYTGADRQRSGLIEKAANGTLFLDEIGDLPLASQLKLLRLLQDGQYYPVGSDRASQMSARIVVATNQNLAEKQKSGQFRNDLFYRVCTHQIHIPPLRERKEDIPLLLHHFLEKAAKQLKKKTPTIPKELPVLLMNYAFPGNVRELEAMVFDAVSVHKSKMLSMATFKRGIEQNQTGGRSLREVLIDQRVFDPNAPLPELRQVADLLVLEAMRRAKGNQSIAARLIGVSQPALSKRLKKMGPQPL
jgi:DNA-binding NtrC family response regulator